MKKLAIILLSLLLLIVGAIFYAAYNANSIIANAIPRIEKIASEKLNTKVTLEGVTVSTLPLPSIAINKVAIGNKAETSIGSASLSLNLWKLFSKELNITKLKIQDPKISLIKGSNGFEIVGFRSTENKIA